MIVIKVRERFRKGNVTNYKDCFTHVYSSTYRLSYQKNENVVRVYDEFDNNELTIDFEADDLIATVYVDGVLILEV
jgi:hypothetical protein